MHKPTSGSTAGKHGYGTPAANSPPISRPLGPKYGLAARASQDTNKDSPFWEPPWELRSTNNTTCNTYAPNTTNFYNNFHTSKTCRRVGYSSSTAQAPVAYTNSGCCLPTSQPNSPKTTTPPLPRAFPSFLTPAPSRKLSCPHDNALSFVLKRNQGFLTAVVICECSRNLSGSGWEVGFAFHLKGCSASGRHGAMIGKWGVL